MEREHAPSTSLLKGRNILHSIGEDTALVHRKPRKRFWFTGAFLLRPVATTAPAGLIFCSIQEHPFKQTKARKASLSVQTAKRSTADSHFTRFIFTKREGFHPLALFFLFDFPCQRNSISLNLRPRNSANRRHNPQLLNYHL